MRIAVAREADPTEDRVAATPETIKKMKGLGADVAVEPGAGTKSGIPDADFVAAGAAVAAGAVKDADVVLKVRRPSPSELAGYKKGALVIAIMILGGGVAGSHAALISAGMGATVTVVDRNPDVLRRVAGQLGARVMRGISSIAKAVTPASAITLSAASAP